MDLRDSIVPPCVSRPVHAEYFEFVTSNILLVDGGVRSEDVQIEIIWGSGSGLVFRTLQSGKTMPLKWFKHRSYRHLDLPVNSAFAQKATSASFVSKHSFSPLLHFTKSEKRYKKSPSTGIRVITKKDRPIKFASHRDACILSYYSHMLEEKLNAHYISNNISDSVIAYRSLGKANYDFSAEALSFAIKNSPVTILAFDVTGFFDNLDHSLLKKRLKTILNVTELSDDWYKVFKSITKFHYLEIDAIKSNIAFSARFKEKTSKPIASIKELKDAGIEIHSNPYGNKGIPQGTPISASASNLYLMEFDAAARMFCNNIGAMYRRYSDDILIICKPEHASNAQAEIARLLDIEKLEIAPHKTETTAFDAHTIAPASSRAAQYLGFTLAEDGAAIRGSSLSRQWRKMRRSIKKTRKFGEMKISTGAADKIYTKKLVRKFTLLKVYDGTSTRTLRNFSSYGRRSASAFGPNEKISQQVKRFEKTALRELKAIKSIGRTKAPRTTPKKPKPGPKP